MILLTKLDKNVNSCYNIFMNFMRANNRNTKLILSYFLIFIVFLFLGAVIFLINKKNTEKKVEVGAVVPINDQIKPDTLLNPFNFLNAKIGDISSGFEITKISSYAGDEVPTLNNLTISFKNKKLISGQLNYYESGPLQGKVCLENYDPYAQNSFPRVEGDVRLAFVCFNNSDEARKLISEKEPGKTLNVYIDNYTINLNGDNAVNTADLVK